jgi:glycosyltransferase involved in cell wall biosynthesis
MAKLSIITVCLNDFNNFIQTYYSVINQSYTDYEYIVIDGGSVDGTADFVASHFGVSLFVSEPDNGIFDAMNKALKLCSGDYVCFLNAGDTFYSSKTLSLINFLIDQNPNINFFYGDIFFQGSTRPFSIQPSRLTQFSLFRGTVCHQAWFVRKEVYNKNNGFNLELKYKGDYDFLLRIILKVKEKYMHFPLCVVNYQGGGFSERTFIESRGEFEMIRRKYLPQNMVLLFSFVMRVIEPIQKNSFYQSFMARYYSTKAKLTWS